MTATNHALTGAIIGLSLSNPLLAVPLALVSHFALDALPHFGFDKGSGDTSILRTKAFIRLLVIDIILCLLLVATIVIVHPGNWLLATVCAFVATSPDTLSINRFMTALKGKEYALKGYQKFARDIQWFERPIGSVVELAWFISALVIWQYLVR